MLSNSFVCWFAQKWKVKRSDWTHSRLLNQNKLRATWNPISKHDDHHNKSEKKCILLIKSNHCTLYLSVTVNIVSVCRLSTWSIKLLNVKSTNCSCSAFQKILTPGAIWTRTKAIVRTQLSLMTEQLRTECDAAVPPSGLTEHRVRGPRCFFLKFY